MKNNGFVIRNGVLAGYKGPGGDIEIPQGVTVIGSKVFSNCDTLTGVVIPEGVVALQDGAFADCKNLKSVSLPDSLEKIGAYAFDGCSVLDSVILPDGLRRLGGHAFYGCRMLSSIKIPDGITEIGAMVFWRCGALTSVTLPDGIVSIGWRAFSCSGITQLRLPAGLRRIDAECFMNCTNLAGVALPDRLQAIGNNAFDGCKALKSIYIPDSVTAIGPYAFCDCNSLTDVHLPQGLDFICTKTFCLCKSLVRINIPDGVIEIGNNAFEGCEKLATLRLPDSIRRIGEKVFKRCSGLTDINIPDNLKTISNEAFSECSSLKEIRIPASVEHIDADAFEDCYELDVYIDGNPEIREVALDNVRSIIAPAMEINSFSEIDEKIAASIGYITNCGLFKNEKTARGYRDFALRHRGDVLCELFRDDSAVGLYFYAEHGAITAENFNEEFFEPAEKADAVNCVAFLLEWKNNNLDACDIELELGAELDGDIFSEAEIGRLWDYVPHPSGGYVITAYKGTDSEVIVPCRIGDKAVCALDSRVFYFFGKIRNAFTRYYRIRSVYVPDTVVSISEDAFYGCIGLTLHTPSGSYAEHFAKEHCIPLIPE